MPNGILYDWFLFGNLCCRAFSFLHFWLKIVSFHNQQLLLGLLIIVLLLCKGTKVFLWILPLYVLILPLSIFLCFSFDWEWCIFKVRLSVPSHFNLFLWEHDVIILFCLVTFDKTTVGLIWMDIIWKRQNYKRILNIFRLAFIR